MPRFDCRKIYDASDGDATRALYAELEAYSRAAYDRKSWSMQNLCQVLKQHGDGLVWRYGQTEDRLTWGWKQDPATPFGEHPSWVLYVELPGIGQASFHSPTRFSGPDFPGEWDGQRGAGAERIIRFCQAVLAISDMKSAEHGLDDVEAIIDGLTPVCAMHTI